MRPNVRRFVSAVMENWIPQTVGGRDQNADKVVRVAEFGSRVADENEIVSTDIRPLVIEEIAHRGHKTDYTGFDYSPGKGVDKTWDLHHQPNAEMTEAYDLIFCLETLEHVRNPYDAVDNLRTMLAPGGLLVLSVPYHFQWHARPHYWGITPDGISALLEHAGFDASHQLVGMDPPSTEENGWNWEFPHTVVGLGWRDDRPFSDELLSSKWHSEYNGDPVSMHLRFANEEEMKKFKVWLNAQAVLGFPK